MFSLTMAKVYPLSGAFMVISLMGLIFSGVMFVQSGAEGLDEANPLVQDKGYDVERTMLFSLMFLFGLMFIASIISMTYGPEGALNEVK